MISTDLHQLSVNGPTFDLPTTLSKFLHLGMSLAEVIEAATVRPAQVLGLEREVGTLQPASRADVALFKLYEGSFPLQDIHGNVRDVGGCSGTRVTIVGGREFERLPPPPRAPWTLEPIWPDVQIPFTEKQRELHEQGRTPDAMAAAAGEPRTSGWDVSAYDDGRSPTCSTCSGRVALVTGAAQGFGFACARRLAEAGAAVLLTDRRADRVEAAAGRLAEYAERIAWAVGDVSARDEVDALVATAVERFGRLDVLVNNAAAYNNVRIDEMPLDTFANVLDVNVNGAFWCARQAARRMIEQGDGGAIVNVTSIDALHPTSKGMSHYTTSKHALWGLTKCLALELGPQGSARTRSPQARR